MLTLKIFEFNNIFFSNKILNLKYKSMSNNNEFKDYLTKK